MCQVVSRRFACLATMVFLATAHSPASAQPSGEAALDTSGPPAEPIPAVAPRPEDAPARRERARRKATRDRSLMYWHLGGQWFMEVPLRAEVAGAFVDGSTYRRVRGGALDVSVSAAPEIRWRGGRFHVAGHVGHDRRETFGYHLPEATTLGSLGVGGRVARRLTLDVRGDVRWVQRPEWPDPYQPLLGVGGEPTGSLKATNRFSFLDLGGTVTLRWRAAKAIKVEASLGYLDRRYEHDPAYDGLVAPTHLAPGDVGRLIGSAGVAGRHGRWRWDVETRIEWLDYRYAFARDPVTGLTHAVPGGEPANPLQDFVRVALRHSGRVSLPARTSLSWEAGYLRNEDVHHGYYTWNDLEAGLGFSARPVAGLGIRAGAEARLRWYTSDGYGASAGHPTLDGGASLRAEQRIGLGARMEYATWKRRLRPFVEASWTWNRTNFPDYEPWVNPVGMPYRIDFDWQNIAVRGGLELRL